MAIKAYILTDLFLIISLVPKPPFLRSLKTEREIAHFHFILPKKAKKAQIGRNMKIEKREKEIDSSHKES